VAQALFTQATLKYSVPPLLVDAKQSVSK